MVSTVQRCVLRSRREGVRFRRTPMHITKQKIWPAIAFALVAVLTIWPEARVEAQGPSPQITRVRCTNCHAEEFQSTARGPHSVLDLPEWQQEMAVALSCLGCHEDVTEHMAARGLEPTYSFAGESALAGTGICLGCHRDTHPQFDISPHARAGIACTDCHSEHGSSPDSSRLLQAARGLSLFDELRLPSALCADCHSDIASTFALNEHHRLDEGIVECTSCHDPHAPATRVALGGFKREDCTDCHEDKGGPFVFEHPSSRVEGCTACHSPHGSPNRHLLASQRVAELCFSCHAEVPSFHAGFAPNAPPRFGLDTQCTNCHSQIHGSNFHPRFLR